MKLWLTEKRENYMKKIIEMKAGPQAQDPVCPGCRVGKDSWRYKDCANKKAVCMLCCRNAHKHDLFHYVEKWNGRFYLQGALWQVGVKIHLGHDGKPCPWSTAALFGLNEYIQVQQNDLGGVLFQVAEQFGLPQSEVLQKISNTLEHANGSIPQLEHDVLCVSAEKAGVS